MNLMIRSKSMAKNLRQALAERQIEIPYSFCLEVIAKQFGFANWNVLKAKNKQQIGFSLSLFVAHGKEQEASEFYQAAFNATEIRTYKPKGTTTAVELRIGEMNLFVAGSNPRRELEQSLGGPFFPKASGAVTTIFHLIVADVDAAYRMAIDAGATARNQPQPTTEGFRAASLIDPFGHIWGLVERRFG